MVTVSKTTGEYLYINLLNFKDKAEQEKWYNIIKELINKDIQERLDTAFQEDKKSYTKSLSQ